MPAERGAVARAKQQIVAASSLDGQAMADTDLAEEIRRRARAYANRWPAMDLTPTALARHWGRLVPSESDELVFEALGFTREQWEESAP